MPGTELEVQALQQRQDLTLEGDCLLFVQEGKLIVDLPLGDYRVLEQGDSILLPPGIPLALQPVAGWAILTWHGPR